MTWGGLENTSLKPCTDQNQIKDLLRQTFQEATAGQLGNWAGQLAIFALHMKPGDWIALPLKTKSAVAFGEITGAYQFDPKELDEIYRHSRNVKWLIKDVPRSVFDQDILYSLGAAMTFCEITRNDAENRIKAIAKNGWRPLTLKAAAAVATVPESEFNLEQMAQDQIIKFINRKFKGHGLEKLIAAILKAKGYTVYKSPHGPDGGVDILASSGPLGFDSPRICVQVKSTDAPIDHPTLNQLIGTMQTVQADHGMLVSWGGFKSSIDKVKAQHFFKVRLWDQGDIVRELLDNYQKLDLEVRQEFPLKQVWLLVEEELNSN